MKVISLKYPATCRDCGAQLAAGSRAKFYGRGRVYGIGCHEDSRKAGSGRRLVSSRCEDYPCCGHGPAPMGDGGGCPKVYERTDGSTYERFDCAGCGSELPANATSALCGRCHSGSARRAERELYGDALMEQFDLDAERAAYNRGEE